MAKSKVSNREYSSRRKGLDDRGMHARLSCIRMPLHLIDRRKSSDKGYFGGNKYR